MVTIVESAGMMRIFYGSEKGPLTARGSNQVNLLDFAFRYPTWHTYREDKPTLRAIQGLEARGSIIVNRQTKQFRVNMQH